MNMSSNRIHRLKLPIKAISYQWSVWTTEYNSLFSILVGKIRSIVLSIINHNEIVRITIHGVNLLSNNLLCPAKLIVRSSSNLMEVIIDVQEKLFLWP